MEPAYDISKLYSFASVDNLSKSILKRVCSHLGIDFRGLGRRALVDIICNHLQISTYSSCSSTLPSQVAVQPPASFASGPISISYLQQLKDWTKSLDGFPDVLDVHIVKSHLLGKGFKHSEVTRYKTTRAWNQRDGVHSLRFHMLPEKEDLCAIRASCNPSMSTDGDEMKLVFIVLNAITAQIIYTHCTCTIGLRGDCSHVGAVLFVLCDIVAEGHQELPADPTCTEVKCRWTDPKSTHCEPKLVKDVNIFKTKFGKEPPKKKVKTTPKVEEICYDDSSDQQLLKRKVLLRNRIYAANKSDSLPPIVHLLPPEKQILGVTSNFQSAPNFVNDCDLAYVEEISVHSTANDTCEGAPVPLQSKFEGDGGPLSLFEIWQRMRLIEDLLKVSLEEQQCIERATCDQNASRAWFYHRQPRITASKCKRAISKRSKSPTKAIEEILALKPHYVSAAMRDGTASEDSIITEYSEKTKNRVEKCGFFVSLTHPFLGASPDGLIGNQGLIEVKKVHPRNSESLVDALLRQHICRYRNKIPVINTNHTYYYQMQQQMFCTGRLWCDFVASNGKTLYIYRVNYAKSFFLALLPTLEFFFKNYILVELAYPRIKLGLPRLGKIGLTYDSLKQSTKE